MLSLDDTICAVASAPGGSARGIVRLSGPRVADLLASTFEPLVSTSSATAFSGRIRLAAPMGELPGDLFFWPNERSYTRQPTAEFHTLGSPPLLAALIRTLCQQGARLAEPGEFTLRAFLAGRLDLTQAEAVLGVIDSTGRKPLEAALAQLAGGLSRPLAELRETMLQLLAHLEAGLDFVEEDIEFISKVELDRALVEAAGQVAGLIAQLGSRTATNHQPKVVLSGLPNVGKSSLFNALAGRSAAIVSPQPGTTRDYLSAIVDFDGLTCELVDTAGVDLSGMLSDLENSAQQAATGERERAQVIVLCLDSTRPLIDLETHWLNTLCGSAEPVLVAFTKCDQPLRSERQLTAIETSSVTGLGLKELAAAIRRSVISSPGETTVAGTAERCQDSLRLAWEALSRAQSLNQHRAGEELVAAELRFALTELGKVVGTVYTDDILDRIFSRFCIGK